ncbi:hypothetical protein ID866_8834 [Astraeus odoratus]|nr:hypothetical protein ID866_8834 [Astraeus odoratus]
MVAQQTVLWIRGGHRRGVSGCYHYQRRYQFSMWMEPPIVQEKCLINFGAMPPN